jgi:Ca-activated chloride channel family protein
MYTIADLEAASGVNRRNIHFYIQQGLVPPAAGAGLGARYDDEHLLRLRAIPVLRNRGLRLDEIREKLARIKTADLQGLLSQPQPPPGAPVRTIADGSQSRVTGRTAIRYEIAPGVEVLVDAGVSAATRDKVRALIDEAERLFANEKGEKS